MSAASDDCASASNAEALLYRTSRRATPRRHALPLLLAWALLLAGCNVQWVADYDKASEEGLIATYERIDRLYNSLAQAEPAQRTYDKYSAPWDEIATDLRVLAMRQKARPDNDESRKIVDTLVEHWEKTRDQFKRNTTEKPTDPYPQSKIDLDRQQFQDSFAAALAAEVFKK
jgi:hypothetical protein